MASASKETICTICGKANGRVRCEGCLQLFCYNHLNEHRQDLSIQLDEIETSRDLFRQTLTETTSQSQNHGLIQQIDEWERQSITFIRQMAAETKQKLIKYIEQFNIQLEETLNKLTDALRQSRADNDYFEPNLNRWREQLKQLQEHLIKPSNITIRHDLALPLKRITVDISGPSSQFDHYDGIPCEWCSEIISFDAYGSHTIACRDKEHRRLEKKYQQREEDVSPLGEQSKCLDTKSTSKSSNILAYPKCKFCGMKRPLQDLPDHELHCKFK